MASRIELMSDVHDVNITIVPLGDVEAGGRSQGSDDSSYVDKRTSDISNKIKTSSSPGLRILIKDLSYHVASNKKRNDRVYLLKDVSAYLEPGQMTALMGPSGSGKTTLLDLLAGRKTVGKAEGHLSFGGVKPTQSFLRCHTGYVEQFDTLLGDLTVREMLLYTAELKRPFSEPLAEKRREVDVLLKRLSLEPCADIKIGNMLAKGISGGQAKRTNIGIALIGSPRVLLLDEPTSGLDSYTANEVMKVVHGLVADGTTIAATIHSPTAATFALFDRVMLLARGHMLYFGPRGLPALQFAAEEWAAASAVQLLALHHTAASVAVAGCIQGGGGMAAVLGSVNDAEVLVEVVTDADHRGDVETLVATYNRSGLRKENDRRLELYLADGCQREEMGKGVHRHAAELVAGGGTPVVLVTTSSDASPPDDQVAHELTTASGTVTPWYWGLWTLLKYRAGRSYRNPLWLVSRIADKLVISFIILTLYLGVGDNFAPTNLVNVTATLFMWAALPAFGAASYVPAIILERPLFIRERFDGLYRESTYLAAKLLEELLLSLVITLLFSTFVFFVLQLRGYWVVFWLIYFVDLSVGIVLAYLIAALSPNMDVANVALPSFVVTLLFFAGQLITMESIPGWWQWYSGIDFLRYAWGALMLNQFENNNVVFAGDQTILEYYGLSGSNKWAYIGYMMLFWIAFAFLAWLALRFVRHQKR